MERQRKVKSRKSVKYRKLRVSEDVWSKLKMMKGKHSTYNDIIVSLIKRSERSIVLDTEVYSRLCEIMYDNNYASINETIENMIIEIEKYFVDEEE